MRHKTYYQIKVGFTKEIQDILNYYCGYRGKTKNEIIRQAVKEFIENHKIEAPSVRTKV